LAAGFGMPAVGEFEQQTDEIVKHINRMIKR